MKNSTILLAAAAVFATSASAQTFGNPKDTEGNYIVKWNPATESFADANDWEIDETFIFAVDVTGTGYEEALATTGRGSIGRGMAYDLYVTSAPEGTTGKSNIDGRLFHIKDNVYGMVINFFQQHVTRYADDFLLPNEDYTEYGVLEPGYVVSWNANLFPFGWAQDNPGAEWWDAIGAPICGEFPFASAPYTGKKTSQDYFYGDLVPEDVCPFEGLDSGAFHSMCDNWGGYAPIEYYAEALGEETDDPDNAGVGSVSVSPVVSAEYYNIQGQKLNYVPQKGLYIQKNTKADGTFETVKKVK